MNGWTKTKILFFLPSLGGGGAERTLVNIIEYLQRERFAVILVLASKKGEYLNQVPEDVDAYDLKSPRVRYSVFKLAHLIKKEKPDILFSTMYYSNIVMATSWLIAGRCGKLVLRESQFLSAVPEIKFLHRIFIRFVYNRLAAMIVSLSHGVHNDLEKNFGISNRHIVVYNPLNTRFIDQNLQDVEHFKRYTVIAIGRLEYEKHFDFLINAFSVFAKDKDCQLVILGKGSLHQELYNLSRKLKIDDKVFFLGFQQNPFKYLAAADMLVLSSRWEGFGHVIVEAMYCGTPVISADCPSGPSEIITHGFDGLLYKRESMIDLLACMNRVYEDQGFAANLVCRAKYTAKKFSEANIVPQYEALFDNLADLA